MFKQQTKDNINGCGLVFRFVTPLLITIGLWIMGDTKNAIRDVKNEISDVRKTAQELSVATTVYNTNHLMHHSQFENDMCSRLAVIETKLDK